MKVSRQTSTQSRPVLSLSSVDIMARSIDRKTEHIAITSPIGTIVIMPCSVVPSRYQVLQNDAIMHKSFVKRVPRTWRAGLKCWDLTYDVSRQCCGCVWVLISRSNTTTTEKNLFERSSKQHF